LRSRIFAIVTAACAISLGLSTVTLAGVNTWTTQGPPGGEPFRDIAASTTDSNVFYAAYGRSLSRSVDGAVTWQTIGGFAGQVVSIAVDPTDGRRVYVAVLEQGLFRSENGGDTFAQIAPSTEMIWSVGAGGSDGRTVYYATNSGTFYRSLDRGATFAQRTATLQTITRIYVDSADGSRVIALRGTRLARSADGGGTWSEAPVGPDPNFLYALVRLSPTALVLGTSDGIYVSNDDCANWTRKAVGSAVSVVPDPQVASTLYASVYWDNRLWRTQDSGQTWSPVGAPMLGDARGLLARANGTGTRIVAASLGGVLHSENGGTSWTESISGPVATAPFDMTTTIAADSRVLAFTPAGGLFSSSRESAWQRLNLAGAEALLGGVGIGQAAIGMKPGDPRTIYMLTNGRPLLVSTDNGDHWSMTGATLNSLPSTALGFDPVDGRVMYVAMNSWFSTPPSGFYRSTDGGVSWAPHAVDLPGIYPLAITVDPSDRNRIFVAGYQGFGPANTGGLYRSTNGGINWTERGFLGVDVRAIVVDPTDSNRVYAATRRGLQVSSDGGDTFMRNDAFAIVSPLPAGAVVVDPTVPTTLYASSLDPDAGLSVHDGSTIARSVDRGLTWEVLRAANEPLPWYATRIVLDPNLPSLLYVNTGGRGVGTYEIQNDLSVALSGHSGTKAIGAAANLTAHVQHHGALAATAARLDITMPAGITAVTATPTAGSCVITGVSPHCDFPVLRPGATVDVVVSYVPPTALSLPVTARIEAHERDNDSTNDVALASAIAGEVIDLKLSVTPSSSIVDHGDAVSYEVVVRNESPVTASVAAMAFIAGPGLNLGAPPAGCAAAGSQITCVFTGLASGAQRSVTINATAGAVGQLTTDVAVAAAPSALDTNMTNNGAAPAITARPVADLAITATDSADPVQTGGAFNYVIDVRNDGPDETPNVVAVLTAAGSVTGATSTRGTCTVAGSGVTCAVGSLASGATATITVATSVSAAGTNTLHATISGGGQDRVTANNSADQLTTVNVPPASSGGGGSSSGGGGGGSFDPLYLGMLGALLAWRMRAHLALTRSAHADPARDTACRPASRRRPRTRRRDCARCRRDIRPERVRP
jgi:photosystem II stability/assembly factor-like uncharacterized protein